MVSLCKWARCTRTIRYSSSLGLSLQRTAQYATSKNFKPNDASLATVISQFSTQFSQILEDIVQVTGNSEDAEEKAVSKKKAKKVKKTTPTPGAVSSKKGKGLTRKVLDVLAFVEAQGEICVAKKVNIEKKILGKVKKTLTSQNIAFGDVQVDEKTVSVADNEPIEDPNESVTDNPPVSLRPDWDRGGLTKANAMTPLLAATRKLIDANKGCVCLVQVGSFFELYFEQAANIAPKLGLKVAIRKTTNHAVPMAGFPTHQLQKFVKILVHDLHMNVAIIDQHPAPVDQIMHRKVSRIVTPGTLVDESFLNYSQNNYLVGISIPPHAHVADPDLVVGLLWMDVSVGEFFVQQTTMGELAADLKRISPSEIILPKEYLPEADTKLWIHDMAELHKYFVRYHKTTYGDFKLQFKTDRVAVRKTLELFSVREEAAMSLILSYINVNLPDRPHVLEPPQCYIPDRYLHMDARTRDALELTGRSTFDSVSVVGSLLNTIKRTVTPSGTRLLTQWIKLPILDVKELTWRQQLVALFKNHPMLRWEVRKHLSDGNDFTRALQRIALRTGSPVIHLQAIGEGINKSVQLLEVMENYMSKLNEKEVALVRDFLDGFDIPLETGRLISNTLQLELMFPETEENEIPDYTNTDKPSTSFAVRKDHNERLVALHAELEDLQTLETSLLETVRAKVQEIDEKATVSFRALHGRFNNVIYISHRHKYADEVHTPFAADIHDKRKTSMLYKPREWESLQDKKMDVLDQINAEERFIINGLTQQVLEQAISIRKCGRRTDILDITASFAVFAEENDMVCPRFVKTPTLNINQGRHVVVESSLKSNGQMFSCNDTKLGTDGNVWVISGPNMGGKSTYLRQNALIVVLAQIGSFVPASSASLGVVDRIFTRIGASDDIFSDLSTFMVEMVETSNILRNATQRSLAIVDEIGRGTSGSEGLAIAYSTLVSLLLKNRCRTLFATHFGGELKNLLDLEGIDQKKLRFFRTRIVEVSDDILPTVRFDHSLEPGISERSYAVEVARIAGFPQYSLDVATRALKAISNGDSITKSE